MPIVASDIVAYGSASMADDDTPTGTGGAIDTSVRVVFADITATDEIEIISDNAGDTTQTVTVYGRNGAGELVSATGTLSGTSVVTLTGGIEFERVLKIVKSAATTGTVTVRDQDTDTEIATMEPAVTEIRRPFYDAAAEASGGADRDYYEKIFFKNDHGSLTLTSAQIIEQSDPSGNISFALESSLDGSDTNGTGNRQTHTGGYTFDNSAKDVANSQNLTAGSAQGTWLKLNLPAGEPAANTSITMRVSGNTV